MLKPGEHEFLRQKVQPFFMGALSVLVPCSIMAALFVGFAVN